MADVTNIRPGRWALSRIVQEADGTFTTAAMRERIGSVIAAHYPPLNVTQTAYVLPVALIHLPNGVTVNPSSDVRLLPNLGVDRTLGDLTLLQRNRLRNDLEEWLEGYSFRDWDATQRTISPFSGAGYDANTPLFQVVRDVFRHCANTASRPKPLIRESHNTEHLDEFGSDTTANYTLKAGTSLTHDAANGELDLTMANNWGFYYNGSEPGSIEHEAQCTYDGGTAAFGSGTGGGAVRFHTTEATDDYYYLRVQHSPDNVVLIRMNGGTASSINTWTITLASSVFFTVRLAAEGTAGSNVTLTPWIIEHTSSKPSDPGWASTGEQTGYVDSDVNRLDDAEHAKGGVGGHWQGVDLDPRIDFFKVRAISDRGGAPADPEGRLVYGKLVGRGLLGGVLT